MHSFKQIATAALVAVLSAVDATHLTLNDYTVLKNAIYNPPACGIGYQHLDVNKITALAGISGNYDSNCGSCVEVCGSVGCDHLLVVDACVGPDHIDISTTAGPSIVGSDTGNHDVTYTYADLSNCAGIWDGNGLDAVPGAGPNWELLKSGGGSAPAPSAQAESAPEPAPAPSPSPEAVEQSPAPAPAPSSVAEVEQPPVSSVVEVESAPVPAPVAPTSTPAPAPVPEQLTTITPSPTPAPAPAPAPSSSSTPVPIEFYESPSPVASEHDETPSSVCTSSATKAVSSYGTPTHAPAPSNAPGEFYETPSAVSKSAASTTSWVTHTKVATPSPSPPLFTGAASLTSAPVVAAGGALAAVLALLF